MGMHLFGSPCICFGGNIVHEVFETGYLDFFIDCNLNWNYIIQGSFTVKLYRPRQQEEQVYLVVFVIFVAFSSLWSIKVSCILCSLLIIALTRLGFGNRVFRFNFII